MLHTTQASIVISASTSSASGTIPADAEKNKITVTNPTTALCYVTTGVSAATATSSFPAVGAYSTATFIKPKDHAVVAVLLSTGTGTISVTTGE